MGSCELFVNKMTIEIITGSLLDAKEKYIAHQCNCISNGASGIAKAIFDRFTYSDSYSLRTTRDVPGTIKVFGDDQNRYIINLFSQYYPGSSLKSGSDSEEARQKYFHGCLVKVSKIPNLESIAFNWKIGCGLAGGDWKYYLGTLENFAKYIDEKQGAKVAIYKRPEDD